MTGFFSRSLLLFLLLILAACEREPPVIEPPKQASVVIERFLKEVRSGDQERAKAFVSTAAHDELQQQFAADHKKLASAGALTPRFVNQSRQAGEAMGQPFAADGHEVTLVYAAKQGDKWTTATVRIYRYRDEPYLVEFWRVNNNPPVPALGTNFDAKKMKAAHRMMYWTVGGLALMALLGLALLIWVVKRRTHIIAPEPVVETRRVAATVRDGET